MSSSAVVASIAEEKDLARRDGPAARLSSPVLIGRERELDFLLTAALNPPAVVVVEGEAGVGKTRLVRELLARPELRGRRALVGYCQPLREPFPFGPVIDALRGVASDPRSTISAQSRGR